MTRLTPAMKKALARIRADGTVRVIFTATARRAYVDTAGRDYHLRTIRCLLRDGHIKPAGDRLGFMPVEDSQTLEPAS